MRGDTLRVVIADDDTLLREGLARLLSDHDVAVVGKAADPRQLHAVVTETEPDVAIIDIRMPPTHTDEGLVAAQAMQTSHPAIGVLVLSHHLLAGYAQRLLEQHPRKVGYLLKERVTDIAVLRDALYRIDEGECVLDPTIVRRLIDRPRDVEPLAQLSTREMEVLALIAEGRSNRAIGEVLRLSPKTVEAHVRHILSKLRLDESPDDHRRVLAALTYLRGTSG